MPFNFIKDKLSYYRQHWFVKNVAVLQTSSFSANIIQAAAGIFIARLLQPELFGIYALAFGLAGLASILLGTGVQDAITTVVSGAYARKDEKEIKDAFSFLFKMMGILSLITLGFIWFLPKISGYFYGNPKIGSYAAIVVVASMLSTLFFSFSQIALQVVGRIKAMAILGISDQLTRSGLSLIFVVFGFGVAGAMSGHLIGAAIIFLASWIIWSGINKKYKFLLSSSELFKGLREVSIRKYFGFSFWVALDKNIANLYMILPVLLTGIYAVAAQVTFFKLAFGYLNLVLSLLGPISILLNVEFPKMKIENNRELKKNFIKISLYSLGISTILTIAAIIISPVVFKVIYGESFMPSVKYVFGLLAYGTLFGIGVGLGPMWRAINKVKTSIMINSITLGLGIPLGLILIKNLGLLGSVIMITLWFTVSHLISFVYLAKNLEKYA